MTRLYTFVGRVCLAATIAIAALTSALAAAEGPSGEQEATGISSLDFNKEDATLAIVDPLLEIIHGGAAGAVIAAVLARLKAPRLARA